MSFNSFVTKKKFYFIPFSWAYKAGALLYHQLYNKGILKTTTPPIPTICVGNLSVGGTGKTPMVEYLLRLLKSQWRVAVLSRGYKRKTKGFYIANANATANDVGDEPLQFYKKFPNVVVAVGEDRAAAINKLIKNYPHTDVVILDDAYQHRRISPGLNILLTAYDNLFVDDYYLPAGSLRDLKSSAARATIIVVTKCNPALTVQQRDKIIMKLGAKQQAIFFTALQYASPQNIFTSTILNFTDIEQAVLVTGIANPQPLIKYLQQSGVVLFVKSFPDHHRFNSADINDIVTSFNAITAVKKVILTTEKDAMRLSAFHKILGHLPVFSIPVTHQFLFNGEHIFNGMVLNYLQGHVKE